MQKKLIIASIVFIAGLTAVRAQEPWIVPDDKKEDLSPFEFTGDVEKKGAELYNLNCASCHGEPTKSNFQPLVPEPGDPAGEKFQSDSDGELYYKIREGRGLMPSFKANLKPDEVWSVISYIRSYHSGYTQEVAKEIQRGSYDGEVSMTLTFNEEKHAILASVIGKKDEAEEPLDGVEVKLLAERTFGNLSIGETKVTNGKGVATFSVKDPLPGDSEGNISYLAALTDQDAFGVIESKIVAQSGIPTDKPSLVADRAIFNKMKKAPIWLLLSYFLTVGAVWGTLFYILLQFRTIFMIGKEPKE